MIVFADIVTRFKDAAFVKGYNFVYGTRSVINLIDADPQSLVPDQIYLLLLPVVDNPQTGRTGATQSILHNCRFMLVAQNQIDHMQEGEPEDYYYQKYVNRVVRMKEEFEALKNTFICPGLVMSAIRIEEVVNQFDSNLDGIMVACNITSEASSFLIPIITGNESDNESDI